MLKDRIIENIEHLKRSGFLVIDKVFSNDYAASLESEIEELYKTGLMKPNQVQYLVKNEIKPLIVTKPGIFEADLFDNTIRNSNKIPELKSIYTTKASKLAKDLAETLCLQVSHDINGRVVKLQYNSGEGGCFPCHYDNPGRPNRRILTCAFYLNTGWKEGDGGELILHPFLEKEVTLPPLFNRLVIFRSDTILHSVKPANKPRKCFTIWFDSDEVNKDEDVFLKIPSTNLSINVLKDYFKNKPVQRLVARAVYSEEFESTLKACFHEAAFTSALAILQKQHLLRLQSLLSNFGLKKVINMLREEIGKSRH